MCITKLIEAHNIWWRVANGQKLGNMGNLPAKERQGLKLFLWHIHNNHLKCIYVDFVMVILFHSYLCLGILNDKYIIIDNK